MKQTIKFLDVLDIERKKSKTLSHNSTSSNKHSISLYSTSIAKDSNGAKYRSLFPVSSKRQSQNQSKVIEDTKNNFSTIFGQQNNNSKGTNQKNKFPFFKALHFNDSKFEHYPEWLTGRDDFTSFMYSNYESKLLTIPKICQKEPGQRASDQKYFISLYLQQIQIFQGIPQLLMDNILTEIRTKRYQPGDIVHDENQEISFMAVVFVGCVEFSKGRKVFKKQRNEILMSQAFYKSSFPTVTAKEETVLLCIDKGLYKKMQQQLKSDIYDKNRAQISDMMKSDFFVELHIKEKRARQFYEGLTPEFYFKNEQICEAGQEPDKFYLHFKGQVLEQNHIYIRQHNKWPLPNRRWEVRAVYNSYQNQNYLNQYSFFGDEQIIGQYKFKSSYYAKSFCILYSMPAESFKKALTVEDFKRLKKYRNEHVSINYTDFEQKVRSKVQSEVENKKIIHKAINTSYSNKTVQNLSLRRMSLLEKIQNSMLQKKTPKEGDNEESKSFFK